VATTERAPPSVYKYPEAARTAHRLRTYYTTLEFPNGQRKEHTTIAEAAAQACPGDVGMAYRRDKKLVHFERILI
jgi:hypothetical protein